MNRSHPTHRSAVRRRIRLDATSYSFPGPPFSVTVCARARRATFATSELADIAFTSALRLAEITRAPVHALCVMPDHAHILIEASPTCDVVRFVARWKSFVSHRAAQLGAEQIWQPRFHDHALRREQDLEKVALYIIQNPVRAGLVATVDAYPWSWMRR